MCTIISVSKAFFAANGQAVLDQIKTDSYSNRDGYGLVLCGKFSEDAVVLKAKSVAAVEHALCFLEWERAWIHCRASTTDNETLEDCHPFSAFADGKVYYVMHNGILSGFGSDQWRVDSKLVCEIVSAYGVQAAIGHLLENQSFANVFIVCPESGDWYVSRSTGGTLHTDGAGNYSSKVIGPISKPVPPCSIEIYKEPVCSPYSETYYTFPNRVPEAQGLPAQALTDGLRKQANDWLVDNYEDIADEWDRYESARLCRRG